MTETSSLAFDITRGLASQLVVVGHALIFFEIGYLAWIQNSAVVVFFILSGFIIPYSTFWKTAKDPLYDFRMFFIDRFARIYAGFLPGIVFVAIADLAIRKFAPSVYTFEWAFNAKTFLGNLLMLQDFPILSEAYDRGVGSWAFMTSFGSARPFWTVAIEWWIYLLFGWLVLRHRRRQVGPGVFLVVPVLVVVPAFNLVAGRGSGLTMVWILGMVAYVLVDRVSGSVDPRWSSLGAVAFLTAAAVRLSMTLEAYDVLYAALLAAGLFFAISALQGWTPTIGPRVVAFIRYQASYSYTLYLVHYTILVGLLSVKDRFSGWMLVAIGLVGSNVVAVTLGIFFERRYRVFAAFLRKRLARRSVAEVR